MFEKKRIPELGGRSQAGQRSRLNVQSIKSIGSILKKQKVFWFDHEDLDKQYEMIIELPDNASVEECVEYSVKLF